jgi:hypothetical protein
MYQDLDVTANSFFLSQLALYVVSLNHPTYDHAAVETAVPSPSFFLF